MRLFLVGLALASTGCAYHPIEFGQEAEGTLLSRPMEQVIQCLGPPDRKKQSGMVSVWSYDSSRSDHPASQGDVAVSPVGQDLDAMPSSDGTSAHSLQCTMNVVMDDGYVSAVRYTDSENHALPTGAHCPFAVMAWCPKITAEGSITPTISGAKN